MEQRKPGCICELDPETGEPVVPNYAMCPVHKPEAPRPDKFAKEYIRLFEANINWEDFDEKGARIKHEKLCALKLVDEIILVLENFGNDPYAKGLIAFYDNIKEEMQKL